MSEGIYIGTSGWSYKSWKGTFYPPDIKERDFLSYYSSQFNCTEINSSFYHMPKFQTVKHWTATVDKDFRFCPKISKYITHTLKLDNTENALRYFFEIFAPMREKMGPVLIQIPYYVKYDEEKANKFFDLLAGSYNSYRFAFEARDTSWFTDEALKLMEHHSIILVISQSHGQFPFSEKVTSNEIYCRFHGPGKLYASGYSVKTLEAFAKKFKDWNNAGLKVWAFFNNDAEGHALEDAKNLQAIISGTMTEIVK